MAERTIETLSAQENDAARTLLVDALLFGNAMRQAGKRVRQTPEMPAEHDKRQPKAALAAHGKQTPETSDAFTAALACAVVKESNAPAEPFRAWKQRSGETNAPRPAAAVRIEDAVQARKEILAGKRAEHAEEQHRSAWKSYFRAQQHGENTGKPVPFTAGYDGLASREGHSTVRAAGSDDAAKPEQDPLRQTLAESRGGC